VSPLGDLLRTMIAQDGPVSVERYMALALGHPTHGYYKTRDPLGVRGDFTTAPEISQMFGELVGLWAAEAWQALGAPRPVNLVELGPGRGTMMADALRAARVMPAFLDAIDVHLIETSPALVARQRTTLADSARPVAWHSGFDTIPSGPSIILANEFFDALPVRHYVSCSDGWRERMVGLDTKGDLAFGLAPDVEPDLRAAAPEGAILEIAAVSQQLMATLAARIAAQGGALLVIDYGHTTTVLGETLQAVRWHRFIDPLDSPGEADLTAHVDFAALVRAARASGAIVRGPVTQAFFLEQIGIRQRAATLTRRATPEDAQKIGSALNRLVSTQVPTDMGTLFKVMAVVPRGTPPLAGFIETRNK
jgi:NADH dehydrogenase [ubiquinone] 1 alpha subcomplex assembly factor 7